MLILNANPLSCNLSQWMVIANEFSSESRGNAWEKGRITRMERASRPATLGVHKSNFSAREMRYVGLAAVEDFFV